MQSLGVHFSRKNAKALVRVRLSAVCCLLTCLIPKISGYYCSKVKFVCIHTVPRQCHCIYNTLTLRLSMRTTESCASTSSGTNRARQRLTVSCYLHTKSRLLVAQASGLVRKHPMVLSRLSEGPVGSPHVLTPYAKFKNNTMRPTSVAKVLSLTSTKI